MSSLLLIVLLLSLSLHACNARHLGAIHKVSIKDSEKMKFDKKLIQEKPVQLLPEEFQKQNHQQINEEGAINGRLGGSSLKKTKDMKALPKQIEATSGKFSGVVRIESLVTVSWRIPHDKHGEHPGFNLDYSPPKTHPPSHN
ncbi:root meristem growth factor 10 [Tasmannia lanceolata]|uniref:root meristem growth factor 10 n=1 Tax=Tasmannia lanceolata TaxID=3420 RepID=UPI004063E4B6